MTATSLEQEIKTLRQQNAQLKQQLYAKSQSSLTALEPVKYPEADGLTEQLEQRIEERTQTLQRVIVQLQAEIREAQRDEAVRNQAEVALAASEAKFRSLVEHANGVIFELALNGTFTYLSPHFTDVWGFEISEVMHQSFAHCIYPKDLPACQAFLKKIAITGKKQSGLEFRAQCKDSSTPWMMSNASPLYSSRGQLVGFQGIAFDISDRKQADAALHQSEKRFRDVSEAAGEYLWELSAEGIYTFATEKSKLIKGYHPAQLIGRSLFEFMPTTDRVKVKAILKDACAHKRSFTIEHRNITPSGEIAWEKVNGLPLLDEDGDIVGFRGAGLSITEQKVAEEALRCSEQEIRQKAQDLEHALNELQHTQSQLIQSEKMSSLGQLVAGVAHEINNPVNFIFGNLFHANEYAQALMRLIQSYQQEYPNPSDRVQAEAEAIDLDFVLEDLPKLLLSMRVGAERIQKIVSSLRTFSRMDEADFKAVDIHEGIDSTLMILQSRLKGRNDRPEITVTKHYGTLPLVQCYAGQLNQVFMNLLSNAIDAIDEQLETASGIAIDDPDSLSPLNAHLLPLITIHTEVNTDNQIVIRIVDNGAGIPSAVRKRLFDPFFTTKPIGKGTGMGLSISYQIVTERHHGTLRCNSSPGKGSEFVIEIPVTQ